ncbi:hypothetical protein QQX98_009913 [Neonectria punicea]|uniref:Uncharacterized protein n=1 Tax=Neonectria punicea TaxID=979145 RepID=A0ABR1GQV5_9HYPO
MSNIHEAPRTDGTIDTAISEQPSFAALYTIDQSANPVIPEQPAFAASYTIDESIIPVIPEQPAFAASYTIDQSASLTIPDQRPLLSSYEVAHPHITDTNFGHLADTSANLTPHTTFSAADAFSATNDLQDYLTGSV